MSILKDVSFHHVEGGCLMATLKDKKIVLHKISSNPFSTNYHLSLTWDSLAHPTTSTFIVILFFSNSLGHDASSYETNSPSIYFFLILYLFPYLCFQRIYLLVSSKDQRERESTMGDSSASYIHMVMETDFSCLIVCVLCDTRLILLFSAC